MIPIYIAKIQTQTDGIYTISLVDEPAIETGFMKFNKESIKLSIVDPEQHIILGPIMRANFPIYRYNERMGEYYIKYTPEVIIEMSKKLLKDNTFNNISLMHNGVNISGVELMQLFIKDSNKGIIPIGFEDIEDGSLFAQYKVEDDGLWAKIKDGEYLGFSLEGLFSLEKEQIYNKYNMTKILKFMQSLIKLGSIETDKATIYWAGEEDLKAGDQVFIDGEAGEQGAEDGEYVTKDGKTITIKDGIVESIVDPVAEVEENNEEQNFDEQKSTEDEKTDEGKEEIDVLKDQIDELTKIVNDLQEKVTKLEAVPATEPLDDKYNKQIKKSNGKIELIYE